MTYWFVALLSLLATWLNIRRDRTCFAIWVFTNSLWAAADFTHGLPSQGTLHLVYLLGVRNRVSVLVNWAWNYLTWDRGPRLIIGSSEPRRRTPLR